jgi:hypothetical protein
VNPTRDKDDSTARLFKILWQMRSRFRIALSTLAEAKFEAYPIHFGLQPFRRLRRRGDSGRGPELTDAPALPKSNKLESGIPSPRLASDTTTLWPSFTASIINSFVCRLGTANLSVSRTRHQTSSAHTLLMYAKTGRVSGTMGYEIQSQLWVCQQNLNRTRLTAPPWNDSLCEARHMSQGQVKCTVFF